MVRKDVDVASDKIGACPQAGVVWQGIVLRPLPYNTMTLSSWGFMAMGIKHFDVHDIMNDLRTRLTTRLSGPMVRFIPVAMML